MKKAYFIGIKGVGMAALAQVLQGRGIQVCGSDTKEKFFTDQVLKRLNIKVIEGFNPKNIPLDVDLIIASAAYLGQGVKNSEIEQAKKQELPIFTYSQILGSLFKEKYGIAVAGTHGKSTVTAMLGLILEEAGLDPTVIVGTEVLQWQSNARVGQSKYLVAEADEYRNSFLDYLPKGLVLTNIEYDHPDFFKNFQEYKETFRELVQKIPANGFIVANGQDKQVKEVVKQAQCPVIKYKAKQVWLLQNAAIAQRAAQQLGVEEEKIKKALANFKGTRRRFEIKGEKKGILLIDDYAHHPGEIQATLTAAQAVYPQKKIWAVFQPHTFTRTKALLDDFARSFNKADQVIILDIYGSAREKSGGVHSRDLVKKIKNPKKVRYIQTIKQALEHLKKQAQAGQIILTMGAGDIWKLSTSLLFSL